MTNPAIIASLIGFLSAALGAYLSHILVLHRLRREALERLRSGITEKLVESYQEFWHLLGPTSEYQWAENLIIMQEGESYFLSVGNARIFFKAFHSFFFSTHGIFLGRELRRGIFEARDEVEELIRSGTITEEGRLAISKTQAKRIMRRFYWIRMVARRDLGLQDARNLVKEMTSDDA